METLFLAATMAASIAAPAAVPDHQFDLVCVGEQHTDGVRAGEKTEAFRDRMSVDLDRGAYSASAGGPPLKIAEIEPGRIVLANVKPKRGDVVGASHSLIVARADGYYSQIDSIEAGGLQMRTGHCDAAPFTPFAKTAF